MFLARVKLGTIGVAIATSMPVGGAVAQQRPSTLVGERVRLTLVRGSQPHEGRVLEIGSDSLVFLAENETPIPVALSNIERLELSRGVHRNTGRGAWIGAVVGLVSGTVVGLAAEGLSEGSSVAIGAALFTPAGTLLGVAIGALARSERWTDVPRERWSFSVGAGQGVEIAFRFAL